jgi:hypothetical protein
MGAFSARGNHGQKTGLSAPSPRKAPMRFPVGFPLQSLARAAFKKNYRKAEWEKMRPNERLF